MPELIDHTVEPSAAECPALPAYEPPLVLTYRGEEILQELGPAQACSFLHSVVLCG